MDKMETQKAGSMRVEMCELFCLRRMGGVETRKRSKDSHHSRYREEEESKPRKERTTLLYCHTRRIRE